MARSRTGIHVKVASGASTIVDRVWQTDEPLERAITKASTEAVEAARKIRRGPLSVSVEIDRYEISSAET